MRKGYSPVILIDGEPNSGKTVLGGLIAEAIHYHFHRELWPVKKLSFWDMDNLSRSIDNIRKSPVLIPEAGFELAFDKWQSPTNRFFDIILQTQRVLGNCYILNIPVDMDLAKRQRRKSHYRIRVKRHSQSVWYDLQKKSRKKRAYSDSGVYMGTFSGYSHKDLRCLKILDKLDRENKERIREETRIVFHEKMIKGKTRKRFKHICSSCGYEWVSHVEKPRFCPDCRKRLYYD